MPERLGPPRENPLFDRLALIGLGLIGSSIARAARNLNLARTIVAVDRMRRAGSACANSGSRRPRRHGPGRPAADTSSSASSGAYGRRDRRDGGALKPGRDRSDVGSVKAAVVADVTAASAQGVPFRSAQPFAGRSIPARRRLPTLFPQSRGAS
jgi:cyclohexadieny/prephenate dehydrogenase